MLGAMHILLFSVTAPHLRRRLRQLATCGLAAIAVPNAIARAQGLAPATQTSQAGGASASRAQLESFADRAERMAVDPKTKASEREGYREQASNVRERLRDGDFRVGDQIQLRVEGDSSLRGTFTVQAPRVLVLPNIPEIQLDGILRSELREHLTAQLAHYLRDPRITVTPLLQVAVVGEVRTPGFYRVPAEMPLSDLMMQAGGPTPAANLSSTSVRRGSAEIASARSVSEALAAGSTLDQLSLRAGDEIVVGQTKSFSATSWLQPLALISGIVVAAISLRHR
jgi:hypothetical protein